MSSKPWSLIRNSTTHQCRYQVLIFCLYVSACITARERFKTKMLCSKLGPFANSLPRQRQRQTWGAGGHLLPQFSPECPIWNLIGISLTGEGFSLTLLELSPSPSGSGSRLPVEACNGPADRRLSWLARRRASADAQDAVLSLWAMARYYCKFSNA